MFAQIEKFDLRHGLAFHCAHDDAVNDLALEEDVDRNDGCSGQRNPGKATAPAVTVTEFKRYSTKCDCVHAAKKFSKIGASTTLKRSRI